MSRKKKAKFKLLKRFKTTNKTYEVGEYFHTNNIKVIEFLKTNKFI